LEILRDKYDSQGATVILEGSIPRECPRSRPLLRFSFDGGGIVVFSVLPLKHVSSLVCRLPWRLVIKSSLSWSDSGHGMRAQRPELRTEHQGQRITAVRLQHVVGILACSLTSYSAQTLNTRHATLCSHTRVRSGIQSIRPTHVISPQGVHYPGQQADAGGYDGASMLHVYFSLS
jgi:hypothetical protein